MMRLMISGRVLALSMILIFGLSRWVVADPRPNLEELRKRMTTPYIPAHNQNNARNTTLVAHIGEYVDDMVKIGDLAYCATGYGFAIFDVSAPEETHKISEVRFESYATNLKVANGYAFVASEYSGLHIIDVSDPYQPIEVNVYPYHATAIELDWPYAYLGNSFWGVRILDVSHPLNIGDVSVYDYNWGFWDYVWMVKLYDHYLFVSDWETGVRVVDVSDPANPIHVAHYLHPDVYEIEVTDHAAYFGGRGFWVYLMPNPAEMQLVYADANTNVHNLFADGSYLHSVALPDYWVWDMTDPLQPVEIARHDLAEYGTGYINNLLLEEDQMYITAGSGGLQLYEQNGVEPPLRLFRSSPPAKARGIQFRGNYAYVTDTSSGTLVIDVCQPAQPNVIERYQTPLYSWDITLGGSNAFVTTRTRGVFILDITDPANIVEIGHYNELHDIWSRAFLSGELAYIADRDSGMHVVDISNPATPMRIGQYPGHFLDVEVKDGYAFLAEEVNGDSAGLRVLKVQNPRKYSGSGWN